jgi:branched-chain amino acid transport system permease protein
MLATAVLGLAIDRVAYAPLRRAPRNSLLITAIAVSFLLQNVGLLAFTNRQTPFRPETALTAPIALQIGDATVQSNALLYAIPLITLALVLRPDQLRPPYPPRKRDARERARSRKLRR